MPAPGAVIAVHEEGQDGLLFLKNLREKKIDLPVIILAAAFDPEVFGMAVANRAEYLVMAGPADAWYPVLMQLIEKVSAMRRAQDEVAFLDRKLNLVGSVTRHDVLNQSYGSQRLYRAAGDGCQRSTDEIVYRKDTVCPG